MSRLRVLAMAGVLAVLSAERAVAADWPGEPVLRGSMPSTSYSRWDGWSFGVQAGMSNMNTDFGNSTSELIAFSLRNTTLQNEFQPSSWTTLPSTTTSSGQYGLFFGYNIQYDQLVVGFDVAYNHMSSLESSASDTIARQVTTSDTFVNNVLIVGQSSLKLIDYMTFRGRAGYAMGQFLPYAVLGAAVARVNYSTSVTTTVSGNSPTILPPNNVYGPIVDTQSKGKDNAFIGGFVAGLGMDVALLPNVFLRGEWEFIAWAQVGGIRANTNTGRLGIGMKF